MAKVIQKKSDLVAKRNQTIAIHLAGYVLNVVCGVACIELLASWETYTGMNFLLPLVMLILSIVGVFFIHFTRDYVGILQAGTNGEKKALKVLADGLPDSYCCVNNVVVRFEERHNELDLVVVGPSGVFIVEVKNTAGNIVGDYEDQILQQKKRSETKEMRNPVKQVKTHTDILSRYLRAKGVRCWVQSTVFFVNPKCAPEIRNIPQNGVQVFAVSQGGAQKLVDFIQRSKEALSKEQIEQIIGLL